MLQFQVFIRLTGWQVYITYSTDYWLVTIAETERLRLPNVHLLSLLSTPKERNIETRGCYALRQPENVSTDY